MTEFMSSEPELEQVSTLIVDVSNWRVLGSQLGLSTSKLDEIESNSSTAQERKTRMIEAWFALDLTPSWQKLLKALQAPAMAEWEVARRINASLTRRGSSFSSTGPLTPTSPTSPTQITDSITEESPLPCTIPNVVNEIAHISNYRQLGHFLGVASVHLNAIEHHPVSERNQRLVEGWFKSGNTPTWKQLRSAIHQLKKDQDPATGILDKDHYKVCHSLKPMTEEQIRQLGLALGLANDNLEKMKRLPDDMVAAWLREEDWVLETSGTPTWNGLANVLEEIGQTGIADTVRKSITSSTMTTSTEDHIERDCSKSKVVVGKRERKSPQPTTKTELRDKNVANVKSSFARLVGKVASNLSEKKIKGDILYLFLVELFSNRDISCNCIPRSASVVDMFEAISTNRLWDYERHENLLQTAKRFGEDDKELKSEIDLFKKAWSHYRAAEKIVDYIDQCREEELADPDKPLPEEYLVQYPCRLTFKLKVRVTDQTLKYVDDLWRDVADILLLPPLSAILKFIADGSILITWRITSEAEVKIREKISVAYRFFRERRITLVEIDGECVYDEDEMNKEFVMACHEGKFDKVEALLQNGVDVNTELKESRWRGVHFAAQNGDSKLMNLLITKGADMKAINTDGKTALMIAQELDHREILEILEQQPSERVGSASLFQRLRKSAYGFRLVWAARRGNVDGVRSLLEKGANVNYRENDPFQWTALMWASTDGRTELVKLLLENGADPTIKATLGGWNALILASKNSHYEVVKLLVDYMDVEGVNAQSSEGWTALMWAAQYRDYAGLFLSKDDEKRKTIQKIAECLLDNGADPNIAANNGWSPVMQASQDGHAEFIDLLARTKCDPDHKAEKGMFALMAATLKNHSDVIDALTRLGANVDLANDKYQTALHIACFKGYEAAIQQLIQHGANINAQDRLGFTPLMVAIKQKYVKMVENLVGAGADIQLEAEGYAKWTAITFAIKSGDKDIVRCVLSKNPNLFVKDTLGHSALIHAHHKKFVQLLSKHLKEKRHRFQDVDEEEIQRHVDRELRERKISFLDQQRYLQYDFQYQTMYRTAITFR